MSLEVLRNGDLSAPASLPWRLLPGTATSPADYSGPLSGQMDFAAREGSRVLQVPLTPDALEEPDEQFIVWLRPGAGDALTAPWGPIRNLPEQTFSDGRLAVGTEMVAAAAPAPPGQVAVWRRAGFGDAAATALPAPLLPALQAWSGMQHLVVDGFTLAGIVQGTNAFGFIVPHLIINEYSEVGGQWSEPQVFVIENGATAVNSMLSLGLSGDRIALGAAARGFNQEGAVDIYRRHEGVWGLESTILSDGLPSAGGNFGHRVQLTGTALVVSRKYGSAHFLFTKSAAGPWQFEAELPDGAAGAFDGQSVVFSPYAGGLEIRTRDAGGPGAWGVAASGPHPGGVSRVWRDGGDLFTVNSPGFPNNYAMRRLREMAPGQISEVQVVGTWAANLPEMYPGPGALILKPFEAPPVWYERGAVPVTILDDDGFSINVACGCVREDAAPAMLHFEVQLNRPAGFPLTVSVETVGGTATAGDDFTALTSTITIPAGMQAQRVEVPLLADDLSEPDETVVLRAQLQLPGGGAPFVTGECIIANDDVPALQHVQRTVVEGDVSRGENLVLNLSSPAAESLSVPVWFAGTAQNPADFTATPQTLVFPQGIASTAAPVSLMGEYETEGSEYIFARVVTGAAPPLPGLPWYFAGTLPVTATDTATPHAIPAGGNALYVTGTARQVITRLPGGGFSTATLGGLPAGNGHDGAASACSDVIGQLHAPGGNGSQAVAFWTRDTAGWSTAHLPFPAGSQGTLDGLTVQSGFAVVRSSNILLTLLRHAGGKDRWGVAASTRIEPPASIPVMASGPDWLAIGAPNDSLSGEVRIYRRSFDSPQPWTLEATLRPQVPEPFLYFGSQLSSQGDLLVVANAPTQSLASRATSVFQRHAGGPAQWGRVHHLPGDSYVTAADRAVVVATGTTTPQPNVIQIHRPAGAGQPWTELTAVEPGLRGAPAFFGSTVMLLGSTVASLWNPSSTSAALYFHEQAASVLHITDDDPAPILRLRDAVAGENQGPALLTVDYTGTFAPSVTFTLTATGGSALPGRDFTMPSIPVSGLTIPVPLLNDDVMEHVEEFTVTLLSTSSGKIARATATVTVMDDDADPARSTVLLASSAPVRVSSPTSAAGYSTTWMTPAFNDAAWASGNGTPGYDRDPPGPLTYHSLISYNVESLMYNRAPTLLTRARFPITQLPASGYLTLRLRYDDGYAVWLNGRPIGNSERVVLPLAWNAEQPGNGVFGAAEPAQTAIQIPAAAQLTTGTNVLAVHGLNTDRYSSDFLLRRELLHTRPYQRTYLDWIGQWQPQLTAVNYGPGADLDADGTSNLMEWASGTATAVHGAGDALGITASPNGPLLQVTAADPLPAVLTCTLQSSSSPAAGWTAVAVLNSAGWSGNLQPVTENVPAAGRRRWTFVPPESPHNFYRLHVSMTEE